MTPHVVQACEGMFQVTQISKTGAQTAASLLAGLHAPRPITRSPEPLTRVCEYDLHLSGHQSLHSPA
jgi:hypothetical protein